MDSASRRARAAAGMGWAAARPASTKNAAEAAEEAHERPQGRRLPRVLGEFRRNAVVGAAQTGEQLLLLATSVVIAFIR